jgi:hypothetical protein
MALLATHVRFALDISDRLPISDMNQYCAGAVYPDSRYITGIPRELTHFQESPSDAFAQGLTDFERGWAAHNMYDRAAKKYYIEMKPDWLKPAKCFNQAWCIITAGKIVEDKSSYLEMKDKVRVLREVSSDIRPFDEDVEKLARHYTLLHELYVDLPADSTYASHLCSIGASDEVTAAVVSETSRIETDPALSQRVLGIYGNVMKDLSLA